MNKLKRIFPLKLSHAALMIIGILRKTNINSNYKILVNRNDLLIYGSCLLFSFRNTTYLSFANHMCPWSIFVVLNIFKMMALSAFNLTLNKRKWNAWPVNKIQMNKSNRKLMFRVHCTVYHVVYFFVCEYCLNSHCL